MVDLLGGVRTCLESRHPIIWGADPTMIADWTPLGAPLVACPAANPEPVETTRVSVSSDGTQGNGQSSGPAISGDGRWVTFYSHASNLVAGDTNDGTDVFVHDLQTGTTTRVSNDSDGDQSSGGSVDSQISADGRYITYRSSAEDLVVGDTNGTTDIFVYDQQTGTTTRVSNAPDGTEANDSSNAPSISADGRYITYDSFASNVVAGDTNGKPDVFVYDQQTGTTTRVSNAPDGTQAIGASYSSAISGDGRYVTYVSQARNLVPADTNGTEDVFLYDRQTRATTRMSVASDGTQTYARVGSAPGISADGRVVTFHSYDSNLVEGDSNGVWDGFVHDTQNGTTVRASVASDGSQGNDRSDWIEVSGDGRYVAFTSSASNLVSGDTNGHYDMFVHDLQTRTTVRASVASDGTQGNAVSAGIPAVSGDGSQVVYESFASNLVAGDTNNTWDIFVTRLR